MRELIEATRLANRYVLVRRLGTGGMAEIWLARDERAGTSVALKFLKPELASNPPYLELFHKEWHIGSRLMHAHIGRVFEYHDEPDGPYYSLQYLNGPEFGVLANESLQDALPPFGLLADALRYAHGKGLVHRDIKAANVLLDNRGVPHLIDFGVAAQAKGPGVSGGLTEVAASPGQISGEAAQAADDIYSLGILLHEILTGEPPVPGAEETTLRRPDGQEIASPLQQLVRDMLATEPGRRPSAETVKDRLRSAGFPPGPARSVVRRENSAAETVEPEIAIKSIQPLQSRAAESVSAKLPTVESKGLAPKSVLIALGVLLLFVVGVVFVLPSAVDTKGRVSNVRDIPDVGVSDRDENEDEDATAEDVPASGVDGDSARFGENLGLTSTDDAIRLKIETDEALGDLLSQLERLKFRGIERWGGQPYLDVLDVYAEGDQAYLSKNYRAAGDRYRQATDMLEPFYDQIDDKFQEALSAAKAAFDADDFIEAIRLYDMAVAISPGHEEAERGLERAVNLEAVLKLMDQGARFEDELELDAARLAFEKALELDSKWEPATVALARVQQNIRQMSFESRMSEGLEALMMADFETARAAFNAAKAMRPNSREPVDGLLQVDQELRLARIRVMEGEAFDQEANEEWETAVATFEALLDVDSDLQFAQDGLGRARSRAAVHRQLNDFIDDPDSLTDPVTMQRATKMLLDLSRMQAEGPRLDDQKKVLSILLKRAVTPLPVHMVSDNVTEVSVYKVGKLGRFTAHELSLRPGNYVAVGIRSGFRDVRLEFRVAPEIELQPIVVQCEEAI
jgi:serine/threonine protein kinase/tetratricopeptide (TPR) repeat protein